MRDVKFDETSVFTENKPKVDPLPLSFSNSEPLAPQTHVEQVSTTDNLESRTKSQGDHSGPL